MSETKTYRKPPSVQPSRTHDYLYDPLYSLSSERDHARTTFRANTNVTRIWRRPVFRTMFSTLPHYPNLEVRIDATDPVPNFIPRQWGGYNDQAREALIRYTKFNYDPSVTIPEKHHPTSDVSGQDRYKYFRRPIIPFLQQVPAEVILNSRELYGGTDVIAERAKTPLTRNALVQTDYRDSETQTDPYSPEYVIKQGTQPELLALATLCYERGLPAGLAEIEMIERARAKRAWEATLPPISDGNKIEQRRQMLDEQERKEWAFRESEIEKLQEARLKVLKRVLKERDEKHQESSTKHLDKLWAEKQSEKEKKIERIRANHVKMIRKLTDKQNKVEGKLQRRDVLKDYANAESQVYAPLSRLGVFPDRGSQQYKVKSRYLSTYKGLLKLEESLPDHVLNSRIQAPKPRLIKKGGGYVTRKFRQQQELEEIALQLENAKKVMEPEKKLKYLERVEKPVPRPSTPTVENVSEVEENAEHNIVFLQKIIRGRAVQNMMFDGKEQRIELISELRSTHALQEEEMKLKKEEKKCLLMLQRQQRLDEGDDEVVNEHLDRLEGSTIGDMLVFLSKELVRFQEERRIHAMSMVAERQRRMREAEESGRRQVEERRRREEDEIFKQVIGVHQETVDSYLACIITGAIEVTADEQARQEIEEMATKINDVAYEMEESRTEIQSEEIVAELVTAFMLPEIERIHMRENIKNKQRKNLLAAHRVVYKQHNDVNEDEVDQPDETKEESI